MEQTNTPQQPSRKKAILSLLVLLALTCVVVFIFSSHWAEISTALAQLSFWQVLLVLAIGLTYPLLEGIVCWLIIRCRLPGFTLRRGMDAAFVGIFGNVVGLGAGAVPMESYYLYHCGLPLGPGVGLMTLQYVFHKTTVLLYATVMLLLQYRWLAANTSGVMHYLPAAYCVVALVIVTLVLLCVSPLVQRLSAQNRTVADPPGKVAGAAGHPGHREPPPAGRQGPLCPHPCRADPQAVSDVHPAVVLHPLHGAFLRAELLAGTAAHQPDALPFQRPAQCSRHGLH